MSHKSVMMSGTSSSNGYTSVVPSGGGGHPLQQRPGAVHHAMNPPPPTTVSSVPHGFLPSFLAGAPSLVEHLDKRLLVLLRDGKHIIGVLRSFDQFTNFVLENTVERKICASNEDSKFYYADIKLGLYLVRGDSVVLLGELDEGGSALENQGYEVSLDEIDRMMKSKQNSDKGNPYQENVWEFNEEIL